MPGDWEHLASTGLVRAGVRLDRLTTYKLGGPARWFAEPRHPDDLARIAEAYASEPLPVLVLGRGSNVVVSDGGFDGLVVHLAGSLAGLELGEPATVAGGGLALARLARSTVKAGRLGLEFLVGIPGSVGGAVRQNAGCLGSDISGWMVDAEVFDLTDGTTASLTPAELDLSYRHSTVGPRQVVVRARFRYEPGSVEEGERRLLEVTRWRRAHQPGGTLNAGSVFKNPPGDSAGRVIDSLGLKGMRVGRVSVSQKHANFFVAEPGATAAEVHRLVGEVRRKVRDGSGIDLEPEIQFVGHFQEAA